MLSNKTAIILILASLIPLGLSLHAVFLSGETVKEIHLKGKEGTTESVSVNPEMNPLRLLINMDYGSKAFSTVQRHITYAVTAYGEDDRYLWAEDGRASTDSKSKVISDQTHYSSLQTFAIDRPQGIFFKYLIDSKNLRYKGAVLKLNRNVSEHNWLFTIVGLIMLVSGVLIFANNKRPNQF